MRNIALYSVYIEKAPLHIGVIVHQIKKYIEVASMCPYLEGDAQNLPQA